jgi:hypothetical protein
MTRRLKFFFLGFAGAHTLFNLNTPDRSAMIIIAINVVLATICAMIDDIKRIE